MGNRPLKIGIACYPLIGGSGILASALAMELARRGHETHVFSYAKPVRLDLSTPNLVFHQIEVEEYRVFEYKDYTLPLAVRMAEVVDDHHLDILHAHYAVPHATAAYLAKRMAKRDEVRIVTTLHGTDTTLLAKDPTYRRAIEYALQRSDLVTTVSRSLKLDTEQRFNVGHPVEVVHNFFTPSPATDTRERVRERLGLGERFTLLHASNLRPVKRFDLLLQAVARCRHRDRLRLVVVAGGAFEPYEKMARELGLSDVVIAQGNDQPIENYVEAADLGIYTSESESFCLSILEAMFLGKASVAFRVGGIPEVLEDGVSGLLLDFGDVDGLAATIDRIVEDPDRARAMGAAARERAERLFTAESIVPQYLARYYAALGV